MGGPPPSDQPLPDTAETTHISSLALIKMLIHGRAGVPMEVMGLMIGEYMDEYTVRVTDVFSMPQSGTGVSVEAVDPEYQAQMLSLLELVGRPEKVVGWYHSHPGFGCWLSGVDVNTAQSFEQLTSRSVAVVIDPIQSVRGKVVIDAFRCISQQMTIMGIEPRQTTSNVGFLNKPSVQALIHGLNRHYYSLPITYRKNDHEIAMLLNVHQRNWHDAVSILDPVKHQKQMEESVAKLKSLTAATEKFICSGKDENDVENVGKVNPAVHLQSEADNLLSLNLDQGIGTMINALVF